MIMKTPDELFEEKQHSMSDKQLIELTEEQLTQLAKTGGRSIKMCVPPQITDTDMLLSELVRRYKLAISKDSYYSDNEIIRMKANAFEKGLQAGK